MSPLEVITHKKEKIAALGEIKEFPHALVTGFTQIVDAAPSDADLSVMGSRYQNLGSLGFWKYQYQANDGKAVFALHYSWDRCKTHENQPDGNMLVFYSAEVTETAFIAWFDEK